MSDVANSGRTVLFVSHQLNAVRRLCPRTIWIDGGRLKLDGPTANVLGAYEAHVTLPRDDRELPRGQAAQFLAWELEPQGSEPNVLTSRGPGSGSATPIRRSSARGRSTTSTYPRATTSSPIRSTDFRSFRAPTSGT